MIAATHIEKSVLACILRHPEQFQRLTAEHITANSFIDPFFREVFTAMLELVATGEQIDLVSIAQKTSDDVRTADIIVNDLALTENLPGWIQQLREYEARRFLHSSALRIEQEAADMEHAPADTISRLKADAERAIETLGGKHFPVLAEIKDQFLQSMIEAPRAVIPMFPDRTEASRILQLHAGEMFVLGGVTGTGKTAFCCGTALEQLRAGLIVAYFCTESSSADIFARLAAAESGVSHYEASRQNRDYTRLQMLAEGGNRIAAEYGRQLFLHGCDSGEITPDTIRSRCQAICNEAGHIDVIYIDFLQDVRPRKHLRSRPALEQINDTVNELHSILIDFQAAGIIPAQFNRSSQNQQGRPGLTAFRDTSAIEQLAHTVAVLWRENDGEETVLYSCKTRNQPPFRSGIPLTWTGTKYESEPLDQPRVIEPEFGPPSPPVPGTYEL